MRRASAQRPEQLRVQVDANLASLRLDQLDVVNLRHTSKGTVHNASNFVANQTGSTPAENAITQSGIGWDGCRYRAAA